MINLDTVVKAGQQTNRTNNDNKEKREFVLMPKGVYRAEVIEVQPWVESKKNVTLKSTNQTVLCDVANCMVTLKINDDQHKEFNNRRLRHNLTTHPNMPWIIPAFIDAIGVSECTPREIQNLALGKTILVGVDIEPRERELTDNETGLTSKVTKNYNVVKFVRKCKEVAVDEDF